jgi:purine-nucleoside phosphorylase
MYRQLGGDAIGMSTVLECIAARWVGLEVCGVSIVTNPAAGYTDQPLAEAEVLSAAETAGPLLAQVLRRFIADFAADGASAIK